MGTSKLKYKEKIKKATPKGGQCSKYPFTTAVAEKTQDTLVPVHKVVGCRSMDECTRFPPDSLSFLLTGYYGFIPLDDLFTDMNQSSLPQKACPEHPFILRRYPT